MLYYSLGEVNACINRNFPYNHNPADIHHTGDRYSCMEAGCRVIELIILGILVVLIISDLKLIRWFEDKKKSCL